MHRSQHAVRAALPADHQLPVVHVLLQEAQRLGRDVLRPAFGREGAEVDLPLRQLFADRGEELFHGCRVHRVVQGAVRETRRREEARVADRAALAHAGDVGAHVRDAAVAEARLEHERRLAERAGVDAASGDLQRVPLSGPCVERREVVERAPLAGSVRDQATLAQEGQAGQRAWIAASDQRGGERDRRRLPLAHGDQVEAGAQRRERLRRRVHASGHVNAGRPRAHPGQVLLAGEEVRGIEGPGSDGHAARRVRGAKLAGQLGPVARETDLHAGGLPVGLQGRGDHVERGEPAAGVVRDDHRTRHRSRS